MIIYIVVFLVTFYSVIYVFILFFPLKTRNSDYKEVHFIIILQDCNFVEIDPNFVTLLIPT